MNPFSLLDIVAQILFFSSHLIVICVFERICLLHLSCTRSWNRSSALYPSTAKGGRTREEGASQSSAIFPSKRESRARDWVAQARSPGQYAPAIPGPLALVPCFEPCRQGEVAGPSPPPQQQQQYPQPPDLVPRCRDGLRPPCYLYPQSPIYFIYLHLTVSTCKYVSPRDVANLSLAFCPLPAMWKREPAKTEVKSCHLCIQPSTPPPVASMHPNSLKSGKSFFSQFYVQHGEPTNLFSPPLPINAG